MFSIFVVCEKERYSEYSNLNRQLKTLSKVHIVPLLDGFRSQGARDHLTIVPNCQVEIMPLKKLVDGYGIYVTHMTTDMFQLSKQYFLPRFLKCDTTK